jgi:hypothetical protein
MIKKTVFLVLCLLLAAEAPALEVGAVAGSIGGQPAAFFYGLSAGFGIVVPVIRLEFEGCQIREWELNSLSVAVKFRPKFGKLAPYVILGAGGEFETLNFEFSQYSFYSMMGCGLHLLLSSKFSLRADLRWLHFSDRDRTRISGGVFLHL